MSGLFQVALILHILCAVVGFGGLIGLRWREHMGAELAGGGSGAVGPSTSRKPGGPPLWLLEVAVYGVPIFGAAAVGFDDRFDFSQIWITLAFLFYVAWVGIWHVSLRPRRPEQASTAQASPEQTSTGAAEQAETRPAGVSPRLKGLAYAVSDLLLVAAIYVMVVKPGGLG